MKLVLSRWRFCFPLHNVLVWGSFRLVYHSGEGPGPGFFVWSSLVKVLLCIPRDAISLVENIRF